MKEAVSNSEPNAAKQIPVIVETPEPDAPQVPAPEKQPRGKVRTFLATHRTRTIIAVGVLLVAPVATWAYLESTKPVTHVSSQVTPTKKKAQVKQTVASPLTGMEVQPVQAARPIVGVVVENLDPDARPQSGLSQAGVVYEALAEGGITRFLAFFQDEQPASIGPVRSLRPYFVDWGMEFNSPVVHAGGDADAIDLVNSLHTKDINALLGGPSQYFTRTSDRKAPHNLYTSSANLDQALQSFGYNDPAKFTVSPRKADEPSDNPLHPNIVIPFSYASYTSEYHYNHGCNCYDRVLAGAPHIDRNTGKQIQVKNVVVEYMTTSYGKSRAGEQEVFMGTPGTGKTVVFRDGGAVEGTWTKTAHSDRTRLLDAAGKEIPLDKGNTWYAIVPTDKVVSY